jgi:hypothetical protein
MHRDNDLTHRDTRIVSNRARNVLGKYKSIGKVGFGAASSSLGLLSEVDTHPTITSNLVRESSLLVSASLVLVSYGITVHSSAAR